MKNLKSHLVLFFFAIFISVSAQEKKKKDFEIHTIAFYNLENLFDTINDPIKNDEASPIMEMNTNRQETYVKKVKNMARVVSEIGRDESRNSPAIIGVSEVENRQVLVDLVNDPQLLKKDYGIVHYDSPDRRGIDVALLYQKALFRPISTSSHVLKIYDDLTRERVYTRDQLLVTGELKGDLIHVIVSHWPSRSGGEARSRSKRVAAAKLNKHIIDSLQSIDPYAKIFSMGDLNDNPTNTSLKDVLKTEGEKEDVKLKGIYNPMEGFFKIGLGSNAYRDAWSLFDQILISKPLLDKDYSSFQFFRAGIFNRNYLISKKGRYKGYPFRSFSSGWTGGFSDHFPVYVFVVREIPEN